MWVGGWVGRGWPGPQTNPHPLFTGSLCNGLVGCAAWMTLAPIPKLPEFLKGQSPPPPPSARSEPWVAVGAGPAAPLVVRQCLGCHGCVACMFHAPQVYRGFFCAFTQRALGMLGGGGVCATDGNHDHQPSELTPREPCPSLSKPLSLADKGVACSEGWAWEGLAVKRSQCWTRPPVGNE